jgi:hypothetical protein
MFKYVASATGLWKIATMIFAGLVGEAVKDLRGSSLMTDMTDYKKSSISSYKRHPTLHT